MDEGLSMWVMLWVEVWAMGSQTVSPLTAHPSHFLRATHPPSHTFAPRPCNTLCAPVYGIWSIGMQ
eukprot:364717-Chlamydomonas_euryale.AAC.4